MDFLAAVELLPLVISSSSSSSDENEDDQYIQRGPIVLRPRIRNFVEDVVESFTDNEFRENFRIHRDTFTFILNQIKNEIETEFDTSGRHTICAKNQLLMAIWRFSTPDSYRSICSRFNIGKATAIRTVRRVTNALLQLGPRYVKWPTAEECEQIKNQFNENGFPDTVGALDGAYIKIPEQKENTRSYICRKGFSVMKLQAVCDHNLKFLHTTAGEVGSCHDARDLRNSEIWQYMIREPEIRFPNNTHLVADKAYPLVNNLMTPYKNNGRLTPEELNFNYKLSVVRSSIERAFALLKKRFRCLNFLDVKDLFWAPKYIIACTILHNICILQNDILELNLDEIQYDEEMEYDEVINEVIEREQAHLGRVKRNRICNALL